MNEDCENISCPVPLNTVQDYLNQYSLEAVIVQNTAVTVIINGLPYTVPAGTFSYSVSVNNVFGPLTFQGCSSVISVPIPPGSSFAQIQALVQGMLQQAAQQQAQCNAAASGNPPAPAFKNVRVLLESSCTSLDPLTVTAALPSGVTKSGNDLVLAAGVFTSNVSQDDADTQAVNFINSILMNLFMTGGAACGADCTQTPCNPTLAGTCPAMSGDIVSGIGFSWTYCVYNCKNSKFVIAVDSDSTLFVIDPTTNSITNSSNTGLSISGIVYEPISNQLFVTNNNDNLVYVYNASTLAAVTTISCTTGDVSGLSQGVYMSTNGLVAVVGFTNTNPHLAIFIINPATNLLVRTITSTDAGYSLGYRMAFDSANGKLYFLGSLTATQTLRLAEIDPMAGTITDHLDIPGAGYGIAYSLKDNALYCGITTNAGSNLVKVTTGPLTNGGSVLSLPGFAVPLVVYDKCRQLVWVSDRQGNAVDFYPITCMATSGFNFAEMTFSTTGKTYIQKTNGNFSIVT